MIEDIDCHIVWYNVIIAEFDVKQRNIRQKHVTTDKFCIRNYFVEIKSLVKKIFFRQWCDIMNLWFIEVE